MQERQEGKGKAQETHVANTAMVINIDSESDSGRFQDLSDGASDVTWMPEYNKPNLLQGKPGESSQSAVTTICIDEEMLDWGNDNDDGMNSTFTPVPNQSFHRMSF